MAWRILHRDSAYLTAPAPDAEVHSVVHVAREQWDGQLRIRHRVPTYYTLILVLTGRGRFRGTGGMVDLEPGVVFWYSPKSHYGLWGEPDEPMDVWLVNTAGGLARKQFRSHLGCQAGAWATAQASDLDQLFGAMLSQARAGGPFAHEIVNHYLAILMLTIHRGLAVERLHPSRAQTTYLEAKSLIDRTYSKPYTVAEFADECGVSYEHLSRLFRRYADCPPSVYLTRLRMSKAGQLLQDSEASIADIALEVGYTDPFAFSKAFKRHTGRSPRDVRLRPQLASERQQPPPQV